MPTAHLSCFLIDPYSSISSKTHHSQTPTPLSEADLLEKPSLIPKPARLSRNSPNQANFPKPSNWTSRTWSFRRWTSALPWHPRHLGSKSRELSRVAELSEGLRRRDENLGLKLLRRALILRRPRRLNSRFQKFLLQTYLSLLDRFLRRVLWADAKKSSKAQNQRVPGSAAHFRTQWQHHSAWDSAAAKALPTGPREHLGPVQAQSSR